MRYYYTNLALLKKNILRYYLALLVRNDRMMGSQYPMLSNITIDGNTLEYWNLTKPMQRDKIRYLYVN